MVRPIFLILLLLILPAQAKPPHPPPPPAPPKPPNPKLDVFLSPNVLKVGSTNVLRITIKNSGDVPVRDLDVVVKSDLPLNLHEFVRDLKPNDNVSFSVPVVPEKRGTFDIVIILKSPEVSYLVERSVVVRGFERVSIDLRSDVTKAVVGQEFSLTLSVVNLIGNPNMTLQVILIPPSGMSITSSYFSPCGGGQFEGVFKVRPGEMREINIDVLPNEPGNYTIKGLIAYYFDGDRRNVTVKEISIPIVVREERKIPGFEWFDAVATVLLGLRGWGRWRISAKS